MLNCTQTSFRLGTDQVGPALCFSFLRDPNTNTNTNTNNCKCSCCEPQPNSTVFRALLDLELTMLLFFLCSKAVLTTIRNTNTRKILRLVSALELTKSVPLCFKLLYLSVASLNKVNPEVSKLTPSLSKYMILTLLFVIFCEKVLSSQRNNIANIEMVF